MLKIEGLAVEVEGKRILDGIDLEVPDGEVHAIMGPNGSGKSTLSYVLAGREGYEVVSGRVTLNGVDLLAMEPEERAAAGLFLAFQAPIELPGVNNATFLRTAINAIRRARGEPELDAITFLKEARARMQALGLKEEMLKRNVNEGFSGGERKRNEMLQMVLLKPRFAILRRDRFRPGYRCAETGGAGGERLARPRVRGACHHPLSPAAGSHRARSCACAVRRAHPAFRRAGTGR